MEEYTFDYGKRMIFKNGAIYLSTDLVGRINIPCAMINPNFKRKKCTVELQDGKVILKYSKDNPDTTANGRRVMIPANIRSALKLKRNDYFKVFPNKDHTVFTLTIATDELTDEALGRENNE